MIGNNGFVTLRNGQAAARTRVSEMSMAEFRDGILDAVASGQRVAAFATRHCQHAPQVP